MIVLTEKRWLKFKHALIKVLFATPIIIWQSYAYPVFTRFHYPWHMVASILQALLTCILFLSMLTFLDIINPLLMHHETIPGGFTIQKIRPTKLGTMLLLALTAGTILLIWYSNSYHMHAL